VPRLWEAPDTPWVDLAEGKLATFYKVRERALEPDDLLVFAQAQLDDVFYLPPVPSRLAEARNHLASAQRAAGTPVLVHLFPGDPLPWTAEGDVLPPLPGRGEEGRERGPGGEGEAAGVVFDVLPALLDQDVDRL